MKLEHLILFVCFACFADPIRAQLRNDGATASFKGSLPPKPTADLSAEQQSALEKELADVTRAFQPVKKHERAADVDIFLKAVRYALEFHEWYDKKPEDGVKKARALLAEAAQRIEALKKNETPWTKGSGMKVFGFYSNIDDSPQPYGVEIPEGLEYGEGKKPVPMWLWLHGRGDTATDIHFIHGKLTAKKPGQFQPQGTIVVHPFGRYCNGWKSAGETDVFECKADATKRFHVDVNRIALAGFSMGGAGAWHIGAHYADQWACVHTGAGFVDVKRYQKITPDKMPPWYEEKLWGVYDVPDYARNFFNVPLISYSGEFDGQRDSAEYMMEVLGKEGLHPPHLIGPGMEHKYHPETIKEVQRLIEDAVAKGRDPTPKKVTLQTRCTRYGKMFWVRIGGLNKLWEEARVDAEIDDLKKEVAVKTLNVAALQFDLPRYGLSSAPQKFDDYRIVIDGDEVDSHDGGRGYAREEDGRWKKAGRNQLAGAKGWGDDGLIDEVFTDRFVVVLPDNPCSNPAVDDWVNQEAAHFIKRWRGLMRGDPIVRKASNLSSVGPATRCYWGDTSGNSSLAKVAKNLPVEWSEKKLKMAGVEYDPKSHVPVLSFGWREGNDDVRLVLNSGLTFREAHDKTNSLQNPKLPDWAILDITQPPNAASAGKVIAADFFDEHWKVKGK